MFKEEWKIYEVLSGSHSYGLNTLESDMDYRGIFIPSLEYFLSPFKIIEQFEQKEPDRVIYDLRKFIKLATENNPNILELLWIDDSLIEFRTSEFDLLRNNRDIFLSAKCRFSYLGYSFSQLKRIKGHKYWLDNSEPVKPKRSDFGLSDHESALSDDEYGRMKEVINSNEPISKEANTIFEKEKEYRRQLKIYQNYQQWKQNRNPKRAELEKKYGYDSKHATHLVRLILQGYDILTEGKLTVGVSDREEIQEVKNGLWSYDKLVRWAEDKEKEIDEIYNNKKYIIPHHPNIKVIEDLLFKILKLHFNFDEKWLNV